MEILITEDAQNHYEQITGGKLKSIEGFGVDPLEGKRELQERQKQDFYHIQKKFSILENAK